MDLQAIQTELVRFSSEREWEPFHTPKNLIMALTGEVGELNEIFQWLTPEQAENLPPHRREHASEEIADVAIYLIRLAMRLEIDLEEAIVQKMQKNALKYPVEAARGKGVKVGDYK